MTTTSAVTETMFMQAIDPQLITSQSANVSESSGQSSVANMYGTDIEPYELNNVSMNRLSSQRPVRNANSMTLGNTLTITGL